VSTAFFQVQFTHQPLEPSVLLLQLLEPLGLLNLHAPILPTPAVVALVRGPSLAANCAYVLALTYLDFNLAQLCHILLGL
jgi:hypothetical protein